MGTSMNSSNFLILSLAVVIAIASCAPKDSVDPFDVVPESDTLLQLKQQMADLSAQNSATMAQMADLSAQNSALRQRVQNLEESLTSTTSPAESLLQAVLQAEQTDAGKCAALQDRAPSKLCAKYKDKCNDRGVYKMC